VGNYDLGICGRDWVEELLAKYPNSALVKVLDLKYGKSNLYMACSRSDNSRSIDYWQTQPGTIRIATEYPNLAESFALSLRLRRFNIFPLWGAAEAYPPENADLALIALPVGSPYNQALHTVSPVLSSSALLIAHRISWESKDLSTLLRCLYAANDAEEVTRENAESQKESTCESPTSSPRPNSAVSLGLPDGHLQGPALEFLGRAGVSIQNDAPDPRRPGTDIDGVNVKMVRPQDMPLQVANGNFDLAVTGEDWLLNHLYRFPSSPVKQILRLGFGKVRIVAVVSHQLGVDSPQGLRELLRKGDLTMLRVASEYTDIADKYARDNHLSPYRLIPTWGASEAFLPEDADVLIENVQTGRTLAEHKLKVIDTLFESSSCLIGRTQTSHDSYKLERMNSFIQTLQQAIDKS
jgi:ATP phosphoribosyltransferase